MHKWHGCGRHIANKAALTRHQNACNVGREQREREQREQQEREQQEQQEQHDDEESVMGITVNDRIAERNPVTPEQGREAAQRAAVLLAYTKVDGPLDTTMDLLGGIIKVNVERKTHDVDSPVTLVFNFAQPGVATDSYTTESDPTLEHPRHLDSQGSGMTF